MGQDSGTEEDLALANAVQVRVQVQSIDLMTSVKPKKGGSHTKWMLQTVNCPKITQNFKNIRLQCWNPSKGFLKGRMKP